MLNEGDQCLAGNLDVSEEAWVVVVIPSKHQPDQHSVQLQAATAVTSVVTFVAASVEAFAATVVEVSEAASAATEVIEVIEVVMEEEEVLVSKAEATLEVDHLPTLRVAPADEVGTADTKTDEMDMEVVVVMVVGMAEVVIEVQPAVIEILSVVAETDTTTEIGMVAADGTTIIVGSDLTMATNTKIPDRNVGTNGGTSSSVYQRSFRLLDLFLKSGPFLMMGW